MDKKYHLVIYEVKRNDRNYEYPWVRKCIVPLSRSGKKIRQFSEGSEHDKASCNGLMKMLTSEGGKLPLPNCSLYSDGWDRDNNYWAVLEQEVPRAKSIPGDDKDPQACEDEIFSDVVSYEHRW